MTGAEKRVLGVTGTLLGLGFAAGLIVLAFSGCGPKAYRVRSLTARTSVLVYERASDADKRCAFHIAQWEKQTGRRQMLDDGTPRSDDQHYRGCLVPPLHRAGDPCGPGADPECKMQRDGYWRIISSLETVDNLVHEFCHRLMAYLRAEGDQRADDKTCDAIHFDGRYYPGRTVELP